MELVSDLYLSILSFFLLFIKGFYFLLSKDNVCVVTSGKGEVLHSLIHLASHMFRYTYFSSILTKTSEFQSCFPRLQLNRLH